jgi:hypothetical protein
VGPTCHHLSLSSVRFSFSSPHGLTAVATASRRRPPAPPAGGGHASLAPNTGIPRASQFDVELLSSG